MSVVRFDQIARECRETFKGSFEGKPIVGLEHIEPYDMLLKNYDVDVETTFTKSFKKDQILFGRRRAYQHKACVATIDGICSGDITVIEPIEGKVYPDLLPFIIQNDDFFEHAIKGSNGALSPRVKWEHMANFEFDLPPLAEQKVLAEKLWAAYEVKQSYLKMIAATEEMVKSQFIEMVANCSEKDILSNIVLNIKTGKLNANAADDGGAYPFYTCDETPKKINDYAFDTEAILVSGNGSQIGHLFYYKGKFNAYQRTYVLSDFSDKIDVQFLFNYFKIFLKPYIMENCIGSAIPYITLPMLEKFVTPTPSKELQKKFVSIAEQADKSISELRKSVDAIDKVIKSLINENL